MKFVLYFTRYWLPAIALMCIIFFLSSRPTVTVSETYSINFLFYKTIHVIVYSTLYFLLFRGFYSLKNKALSPNKKLIYPIIVAILYAVTDEIHQTFVPTRTGRVRDVFIDTLGILAMFVYTKNNLHFLKKFI